VSTTPIKLISGESEFCQTFFDNVKVPKENLVGELHGGWAVAKELLKHERKMMSNPESMSEVFNISLTKLAQDAIGLDETNALSSPEIRSRISQHMMRDAAISQLGMRIFQQAKAGVSDPRLPLLMKHIGTQETQVKDEIVLEILGAEGLSFDDDAASQQARTMLERWAFNKSLTIAGGTSEIQLNIIAKRVLGLPSGESA